MSFKMTHLSVRESSVTLLIGTLHLIGATISGVYLTQWSSLLFLPVVFFFIATLGGEVGAHRLFTHRSFEPHATAYLILGVLSQLFTVFLLLPFSISHLTRFHRDLVHSQNNVDNMAARQIFRAKRTTHWVHLVLSLFIYILLWSFSNFGLIFCIHSSVLIFFAIEELKAVGSGYKNFPEKGGINNKWLNKLTGYTGLANNHITYPASPFYNFFDDENDGLGSLIRLIMISPKKPGSEPYVNLAKMTFLTRVLSQHLKQLQGQWQLYENKNHKDIYLNKDFPPLFEFFQQPFWDDCGFAITRADHFIPYHEDLGLGSNSSELNREDGRNCAILIPIQGDFEQCPIEFQDFRGKSVDKLYLTCPALIFAKENFFHKVDNRNHPDRLFFYINFYGDKTFSKVKAWLINEGLL